MGFGLAAVLMAVLGLVVLGFGFACAAASFLAAAFLLAEMPEGCLAAGASALPGSERPSMEVLLSLWVIGAATGSAIGAGRAIGGVERAADERDVAGACGAVGIAGVPRRGSAEFEPGSGASGSDEIACADAASGANAIAAAQVSQSQRLALVCGLVCMVCSLQRGMGPHF